MSNDMTANHGQRTQLIGPSDPLRRDFIQECCDHVARVAIVSGHAIAIGADELFEANVGAMRSAMREAMRTYAELNREAQQ